MNKICTQVSLTQLHLILIYPTISVCLGLAIGLN